MNYNFNSNTNNNYNNSNTNPLCNIGQVPPMEPPVNILPTYFQITTNNGLVLIDDNGIVKQTDNPTMLNLDRWDLIDIANDEGLYTIRNIGTGRFMAIANEVGMPGTSIITVPNVTNITATWLVNLVTPPGTIPPSPDFTVFRTIRSLHPIMVPDDSSEPGLPILVGTFGFSPGKRFTLVEQYMKGY